VIVAADVHVDLVRFSGLPMIAVSTADAIRNTAAVIDRALAEVPVEEVPVEEAPVAGSQVDAAPVADAPARTAGRRLVAITSCPTGIAHTFMAAEGLQRAAEDAGHSIKVETQGSVGRRTSSRRQTSRRPTP
jgi:PTS system fructose-specific IIC component